MPLLRACLARVSCHFRSLRLAPLTLALTSAVLPSYAAPIWEPVPLRSAASAAAFAGPLQSYGLAGGEGGQAIEAISAHTTPAGQTSFLMATNTGGIYRALLEANQRITWERCNVGLPGLGGYAIAIDPKNPASILLLYGLDVGEATPMGIARTTNRGAEWSRASRSSAFSPPMVSEVVVRTDSGGNSYNTYYPLTEDRLGLVWDSRNNLAGDGSSTRAFHSSRVNGLYRSTDSGASWSQIATATLDGAANTSVIALFCKAHLLFDEASGINGRLYVAGDFGFFYTDDPQSASPTFYSGVPGRLATSPAIHGADLLPDGTVYVTTRNKRIFANSRGGITASLPWSEIVVGNGYTLPTNARVTYVSPNPAAPENIVVNVARDITQGGTYFYNQELIRTHTAATTGDKVTLAGNAWKKFQLPVAYTVTPNTRLRITVAGSNVGEIIGVVLDNDNDAFTTQTDSTAAGRTGKRAFLFGGIDAATVGTWSTVVAPAVIPTTNLTGANPIARTTYIINVGAQFTGTVNHIGFIADVDTAGRPDVNVTFSDIRLYEGTTPPSVPLDFNGMTPDTGGSLHTAYTPGQDASNGRASTLTLAATATPSWALCTRDNSLNFAYQGEQVQRPVWFPTTSGGVTTWKVLGEGGSGVTISPPLGASTPAGDVFGWCNDGNNGIMIGGSFSFSRANPQVLSFGLQDYMGGVAADIFAPVIPSTRWVGNLPYAPGASYFAYHGYGGHAPTANLYVVGRADFWGSPRYLTIGTRANSNTGFTWTNLDTITFSGPDVSMSDPGYDGAANRVIFASNWRCSGDPTLAASWSNMKLFTNPVSAVFTYDPATLALYGIHNYNDGGNVARFNVLRSADQGATWTPLLSAQTGWIVDLAYNHVDRKLWLVVQSTATDNQTVRLLTSTNTTNDANPAFSAPSDAGAVAGFPREAMPGNSPIRPSTVAVDPANPRIVYVGASRDYYRPDVHVIRSLDDGKANTWEVLNVRPGEGGISADRPNGPEEVKCIRINPLSREVWISSAMYGFWTIAPTPLTAPALPVAPVAPYVLDDFDATRRVTVAAADAGTTGARLNYDSNDADLELKLSRTTNSSFASLTKASFARNGAPIAALRDGSSLSIRVISPNAVNSGSFALAWAVNTDAWVGGGTTFRTFNSTSVTASVYTHRTFSLDLAANPSIAAAAANYIAGVGTFFEVTLHNNGSPTFAGAFEFALDDFRVGQPLPAVPAAPLGFTATLVSGDATRATLAWTPLAVATTGFVLERSTGGASGPWTQLATFAGVASGHEDSGLAASTTYTYRLRTYADDFSTPVNASVTTPSAFTPLEAWRQVNFSQTAGTGAAADLADPDGDGVVNVLEYALGTNPQSPSSTGIPACGLSADSPARLTFTFFRARPASEVTYTVRASANLIDWTDLVVNPGVAGETVTVTDSEPTAPRRFLRLHVVTVP